MLHVLAVRATHCLTFNQPQHQCRPNVNVVLSYIQEIWFTKYGAIPCLLGRAISFILVILWPKGLTFLKILRITIDMCMKLTMSHNKDFKQF